MTALNIELAKVFTFINMLEEFEALNRWMGSIQAMRQKNKIMSFSKKRERGGFSDDHQV